MESVNTGNDLIPPQMITIQATFDGATANASGSDHQPSQCLNEGTVYSR